MKQALLKELFSYDKGHLFWESNRGKNKTQGKKAGGIKSNGRESIRINGKDYSTHRLIWIYHNGNIPQNLEIDHIDRNRLNNNIDNLRLVTHQENQFNNDGKGFSWHKATQRFKSRIIKSGKEITLGYFKTKEEARQAYLNAKKELHKIEVYNGW